MWIEMESNDFVLYNAFSVVVYPVMMFPVMQILDGYLIWDPDNNKGKGVSSDVMVFCNTLLTFFFYVP